jgi:hypothetical protein
MPLFGRIRIRLDTGEVKDFATQALANVDDLRPALEVVAQNLRGFTRRVFATEGRELLGQAWEPLRPRTVAARRRRRSGHYSLPSSEKPAHRILHWTHALRDSVILKSGEGHIEAVSATSLIFGTEIPYAAPNQRRRKFLGMTDAFIKTDVVAPIAQFLAGRDPRTARGHRRTRRLGRTSAPLHFDEAAD